MSGSLSWLAFYGQLQKSSPLIPSHRRTNITGILVHLTLLLSSPLKGINYGTIEEFWRSVLTGEKPALPMGQVRKFFSLFSSSDRCKACNIPFAGKSSWVLTYGASAPICPLIFVKSVKIFPRNILAVPMSV